MKKLKKISLYILSVFAAYLAVGYLMHLVIFPEDKPDISTYFQSGQEFYSEAEGFRQTVVEQKEGLVYCHLELDPYAPGPPQHIHSTFDEYFEISNGELTIWVDGDIQKIKPGQVVHIPKGTPHKPYNETNEQIQIHKAFTFPEKFAFNLTQIYGLMDHEENFGQMPQMLFMLAPLHQSGFDSYLAEGPPVFMQKTMSFVLTPLARLLGYKSYYKQYDIDEQQLAKDKVN